MSLPVVAIVGRPNVGKSSLLNCLVGKKISIVDAVAGVTRDRISAPIPIGEGYAELVDTGGFGIEDVDDLTEHITDQIRYAISTAAVVLFTIDAREGITPLDRKVAELLRKAEKPVILVANKVDRAGSGVPAAEAERLGFGPAMPISALHRFGSEDLLDAIAERLGTPGETPQRPVMKLAIVGRRNVGKSTFINALAGEPRVIVSEVPGTTRDSVDVRIELSGKTFLLIDTAGLRRRTKIVGDLEFYARHRALRSIRRADVVLLVIESLEPMARVDDQLVDYIAELYKPVVIVVNKWDLAPATTDRDEFAPYLSKNLPDLEFAPIIFTTAKKGEGVREAVELAEELFVQAQQRTTTGELNQILEDILANHPPKATRHGAHAKLFYASQIATEPPTIVCFVNSLEPFDLPYQRYLLRALREKVPFHEVPIRLIFRPRRREEWRKGKGKSEGPGEKKT